MDKDEVLVNDYQISTVTIWYATADVPMKNSFY